MNTSTMAAESFILKYGIAKRGNVKIWLCDIMGNVIIKKEIENHSAGYFSETLDVGQLPKGLYFIMLKQHNEFVTQKFLRIK